MISKAKSYSELLASHLPGQPRIIVQQLRQLMKFRVAKALCLDRLHGRQYIVAIVSGSAMPLPDITELLGQRQPSGILRHVRDRPHKRAR